MFDTAMMELRTLSNPERIVRVNELLRDTSWPSEERGWLLFWRASALRSLRRVPEAVNTVNEALVPAVELSAPLVSGLTLLRAVIEADLADYVAAEADLVVVERLGVRDKDRPEYYGVKARVHYHFGRQDALELFEQAYKCFSETGTTEGTAAIATQVVRRSLDAGILDVSESWIDRIPMDSGKWCAYRDAYGADLAFQVGRLQEAVDRANAVLSNREADTHARARAYLVKSSLVLGTDISEAAVFAERALSAALAPSADLVLYEPTLIERIRNLIRRCREVS